MNPDTDLGGPVASFPATRCSIVLAAASPDAEVRERAWSALISVYWKPIYKYIRLKWRVSNEDAKDLTQGFLARAIEKSFFERYDASRSRFRTYLRVAVDRFVANERQAAGRLKRGGGVALLPLDFESAEREFTGQHIPLETDPDEFLHREWVRNVFGLAVEELRLHCQASGKGVHFALFQRYDLEGPESPDKPSYAQLATELGLSQAQVTNYLAAARRQFRRLVLGMLRATTGSEDEFQLEARRLLGGSGD
jgi:RNA polymerase sigma factor (sigma-70 family)